MRRQSIKNERLEIDNHTCQNCGSFKHLDVHHIVPIVHGGSDSISNCITLCYRCHMAVHGDITLKKQYNDPRYTTEKYASEGMLLCEVCHNECPYDSGRCPKCSYHALTPKIEY